MRLLVYFMVCILGSVTFDKANRCAPLILSNNKCLSCMPTSHYPVWIRYISLIVLLIN